MKKFVVVGIFSALFFAGCAQQNQIKSLDSFAQCLTAKGVTMYGSATCPHCLSQKAMFGTSFQYITYVECTKEFDRCAKLKGVPSREFKDGTITVGIQELSALASKTACKLP